MKPSFSERGALVGTVIFWLALLMFAAVLLLLGSERASRERALEIPPTDTPSLAPSSTALPFFTPVDQSVADSGTADSSVQVSTSGTVSANALTPVSTRSTSTAIKINTSTPIRISTVTPVPYVYRSPTPYVYTYVPYRSSTPNYGWTQTSAAITATIAVVRSQTAAYTATYAATLTQIAGTATGVVATQTAIPPTLTAMVLTQTAVALQQTVQLAYSAPVAGDSGLDIVLRDGVNAAIYKTISTSGSDNILCDWSPDNQRLVFLQVTQVTGTTPHVNSQLMIVNRDGTGMTAISNQLLKTGTTDEYHNRDASWSPTGDWIAFQNFDGGHDGIWAMKVDGSLLIQLTSDATDRQPDWSPDGKTIVFSRNGNLMTLDVSTLYTTWTSATPVQLHSGVNEPGSWPHYSPDGTAVLFARQGANWEIFKVPGGDWAQLTQLTPADGNDKVEPTWSKDGSKVLFVVYPAASLYDLSTRKANSGLFWLSSGVTGGDAPQPATGSGLSEYGPRWVH
jgi:hypothetical protein